MFKTNQELYVKNRKTINGKNDKIERYKRAIERLEAKTSWVDLLIRPLMDEVKIKFPEIIWRDNTLIPMGLRNAVSIFGKHNGKTLGITFSLIHFDNGILAFDNGKKSSFNNSIGDLNGFNNIQEEIIDVQQVFDYIECQLKD